jgi:hypothetical protein
MTQDPIQPLADIGRRVLQTVQFLATPPFPDQPLESYESLLRSPVVVLSDICNEVLERPAAAPVAAEPEDHPFEPESRFVPDPNASPAFPTFSRAGAVATRTPASGHAEAADSQRENPAMEQTDSARPGLDGLSAFEWSRRAMYEPAPSPDEPGSPELREAAAAPEPGGTVPQAENPARLPLWRPAINGFDRNPEARQTASRTPLSRGTSHPAERLPTERPPTGEHPVESDDESSPGERSSETRPPARQEWLDTWRTEIPLHATARAPDVAAQAENGPARGAGEVEVLFPPDGSRLTGSTERLAAMLRAHVAQPEPVAGTAVTAGEEVSSSRQGDDERGAAGTVDEPARTRPDSRTGIEEIMERLADELETEFVRTYGSSGG